jgi:hypothetical protein
VLFDVALWLHQQEVGLAPIISRGILLLCAGRRRTAGRQSICNGTVTKFTKRENTRQRRLANIKLYGAPSLLPGAIMKLPFITASIIAWAFLATAVICFSELIP